MKKRILGNGGLEASEIGLGYGDGSCLWTCC